MNSTTWIAIAYLLGLLYFVAHPEKIAIKLYFRTAWLWFAVLPLTHVLFNLFRLGNHRSPRDMVVIEIWADTAQWLCLGVSLIFLISAFIPKDPIPRVQ